MICVGHASSFLELVKQSPQSLRVSARLFDQLSEGIVIAPPDDRRYWEAGDFVFNQLGLSKPAGLGYWSKIGQVLKSQFPKSFWEIPNGARQAVGKSVLDVLWNACLEDILEQFDWKPGTKLDFEIDRETIAQVEARKAQQLADGKTRLTIRVEAFSEHIASYYTPLFRRHIDKCNVVEGFGWDAGSINDKCNALTEEAIARFQADRLGFFLPMAALQSDLYTLYEIDAGYRLTSNDWADWQHAAAALPHCDVFFTEAHLAHQLKNVLHADTRFNCRVASNFADANEALDQL